MGGANHNFFNTEWTPGESAAPSSDDWTGDGGTACSASTRLSPASQRAVAASYIAAAVHLLATGDRAARRLLDGGPVRPAPASGVDVRVAAVGGGAVVRPGIDATPATRPEAASRLCGGAGRGRAACARFGGAEDYRTPHWGPAHLAGLFPPAWEVAWNRPGRSATLRLRRPIPLTTRTLTLRVVVDPLIGPARLGVIAADTRGRRVALVPRGERVLHPFPGASRAGLARYLAQPLPLRAPTGTRVDLRHIASITVTGRGPRGRVWVLDATAPRAALPAPTDLRAPLVSLRSVRARDTSRVRVPYVLDRPAPAGARMLVALGAERGAESAARRVMVDIPRGARRGTVSLRPPRRDVRTGATLLARAYAVRGVAVDRWMARVTPVKGRP